MKTLIAISLLVAGSAAASVMIPAGAAPQIVIPAAGSAAGANGTFFRSDVTVANFATHDQQVSLQWLPQGSTGNGLTPRIVTIKASSAFRSADFVADYLGQSGLGAVVISGITSTGQLDNTAQLSVSSRIWTPQPGSGGTTSQSFPAIPTSSANTPNFAIFIGIGGQDNPANYRENVGIVNLDPINAQTFSITVNTPPQPVTIPVSIPPMSMQQVNLGNGLLTPANQVSVQNTTPAANRSNRWIAYGSTVENTTGDAWSEIAAPVSP